MALPLGVRASDAAMLQFFADTASSTTSTFEEKSTERSLSPEESNATGSSSPSASQDAATVVYILDFDGSLNANERRDLKAQQVYFNEAIEEYCKEHPRAKLQDIWQDIYENAIADKINNPDGKFNLKNPWARFLQNLCIQNQKLLEQIKNDLRFGKKVVIMNGSNRQFVRLDCLGDISACRVGKGSAFDVLNLFKYLLDKKVTFDQNGEIVLELDAEIAEKCRSSLEISKFSLGDLTNNVEEGTTFKKGLEHFLIKHVKDYKEEDFALGEEAHVADWEKEKIISNEDKIFLILILLLKIVEQYGKDVEVKFIDDNPKKSKIFESVAKFFAKDLRSCLLPKSLTLIEHLASFRMDSGKVIEECLREYKYGIDEKAARFFGSMDDAHETTIQNEYKNYVKFLFTTLKRLFKMQIKDSGAILFDTAYLHSTFGTVVDDLCKTIIDNSSTKFDFYSGKRSASATQEVGDANDENQPKRLCL